MLDDLLYQNPLPVTMAKKALNLPRTLGIKTRKRAWQAVLTKILCNIFLAFFPILLYDIDI
jgi:hypothetical protein